MLVQVVFLREYEQHPLKTPWTAPGSHEHCRLWASAHVFHHLEDGIRLSDRRSNGDPMGGSVMTLLPEKTRKPMTKTEMVGGCCLGNLDFLMFGFFLDIENGY